MTKILVIDDSRFQRNRVVEMVQKLGFEAITATNGVEGLAQARDAQADCILTDLLMPEMDGFEMIEELKALGSTVPIVVLSADIQKTSRERCTGLGVTRFLPKPPTPEDVRQALESALSPQAE